MWCCCVCVDECVCNFRSLRRVARLCFYGVGVFLPCVLVHSPFHVVGQRSSSFQSSPLLFKRILRLFAVTSFYFAVALNCDTKLNFIFVWRAQWPGRPFSLIA